MKATLDLSCSTWLPRGIFTVSAKVNAKEEDPENEWKLREDAKKDFLLVRF